MKEAKEGLWNAHTFRQKVEKMDALLQIEHLTKLAMEKEQHNDKSSAAYLREIKDVEQTRKKHRCIKFVEKELKKTLTTFVAKETTDGIIMVFTDKATLEEEIIAENIKKYHQTEDSCPLVDQPLHCKIGPLSNGTARGRILDGTYTAPETASPATTDFLRYMRKSSSIPDLTIEDCFMSRNKFQQSSRHVKELISSIGLHIGH